MDDGEIGFHSVTRHVFNYVWLSFCLTIGIRTLYDRDNLSLLVI